MANEKQPTPEQRPLLDELRRAAVLRKEAYRLYLALFQRALRAGVGPSVLARYALISPQAANSTRLRLAGGRPDRSAPKTVDDVLQRVDADPGHGRSANRSHKNSAPRPPRR